MSPLEKANTEALQKNEDSENSKADTSYITKKPKGAKWFVFGAWHKIGEFDKICLHNGADWIVSSKSFDQLMRELKNQRKDL